MGKVQAKKFGEMKKMLKLTDIRIKKEERAKKRRRRKKGPKDGAEGWGTRSLGWGPKIIWESAMYR